MSSVYEFKFRPKHQRGFSTVELLVVLVIMLVVAAVALPSIFNAMRYIKLHNAGTDAANVIQQARIRSVRDNQNYAVLSGVEPQSGLPMIYVDLNNNGAYDLTEPIATFNSNVTLNPASLTVADLTDLENDATAGNAGQVAWQVSSGTTTQPPVFNMRGYPCVPPAIGGGPPLTPCSRTNPGGLPYGAVYILRSALLPVDGWTAITVTPAGRIKTWTYHQGGASRWK